MVAIPAFAFAASNPIGSLDTVNNAQCGISGWSKDPDSTNPAVVAIYKNGPYGLGGVLVANIPANSERSDISYPDKAHGFTYQFPGSSGVYDGADHSIYVYAYDLTGGTSALLSNTPQTIHCSTDVNTNVNVRDFGTKSDGATDDAPAIQKAIDATPDGGTVYLPAGTYLLGTSAGGVETFPDGSPIQSALIIRKNNITFSGDGAGTILKLSPGAQMRIISIISTNVILEKFTADGNKAQRNGATNYYDYKNNDVVDGLVYGSSTSGNIEIRNCEVKNGIEDGIGFWLSSNGYVHDCSSHDNGTPQAGGTGVSVAGAYNIGARILNNKLYNNTAPGVWLGFGASNATVSGNTIENNSSAGITTGANHRQRPLSAQTSPLPTTSSGAMARAVSLASVCIPCRGYRIRKYRNG